MSLEQSHTKRKEQNGLVSVIVPCYNQSEFLAECLESVLAQEYSNWECIIMDDGSTDGSAVVAAEFCKKDRRFHYFRQDNQGVCVARNNAIAFSKGEFLLPLDGDDCIHRSYIAEAVDVIMKSPNTKVVCCKARFFGDVERLWPLPEFSLKGLLKENMIFCTALFRRSDFDKTSGYNPNMVFGWEDWDFWISLLKNGGEVMRLNGIYFFYRIRKNSRNLSSDAEKVEKMLKQLYLNHQHLFDQMSLNPLEEWHSRQKGSVVFRIKRILLKTIGR